MVFFRGVSGSFHFVATHRYRAAIMSNSTDLMKEMIVVLDHDVTGREAATRLTRIRQGSQSVAAFSILFRSLAGEMGWPEAPLCTLFTNALSDPVRDALAIMDPPAALDTLISAAIRIDNRIRERDCEKQGRSVMTG